MLEYLVPRLTVEQILRVASRRIKFTDADYLRLIERLNKDAMTYSFTVREKPEVPKKLQGVTKLIEMAMELSP